MFSFIVAFSFHPRENYVLLVTSICVSSLLYDFSVDGTSIATHSATFIEFFLFFQRPHILNQHPCLLVFKESARSFPGPKTRCIFYRHGAYACPDCQRSLNRNSVLIWSEKTSCCEDPTSILNFLDLELQHVIGIFQGRLNCFCLVQTCGPFVYCQGFCLFSLVPSHRT